MTISAITTPHIETLFDFLKFPSVSTDSQHHQDVQECADWLVAKLSGMGLSAQLHATPLHPVVLARNAHKEGLPTVMIYGHYDVQPVDPLHLWDTPPFEPTLKEGKIYARGATDNKGQLMAHVLGVEELLKNHETLPVNLIFLLEGEEEIGSPNLAPFLEAHKEHLQCDIVAVSDTGMVGPGTPTLTYGLRGITCVEVTLRGPIRDLHSGMFGGAIMNPATAAARMVSTLHDDEGHIQVDGFYNDVHSIDDWEKESWAKLWRNDDNFLQLTGSPELFGEAGYTTLERTWARPTAEVNGIGGGYQGEGSKTVLPSQAFFKLSCRLVPDQDPEDINQKLKQHFEKTAPAGVTVEVKMGHAGKPYLMDPHSPYGKAAQKALETTFNKPPALIREGGSIPIVQSFQEILGVDTLLLGLALPDSAVHAPNENFPIENFEAGILMSQNLLQTIAAV